MIPNLLGIRTSWKNKGVFCMDEICKQYFDAHKRAAEHWTHGGIAQVWTDEHDNICIRYEDGAWWHYNTKGEWW